MGSSLDRRQYKVVAPSAALQGGGDLPVLELFDSTGAPLPTQKQAAHQADTVAADLTALKADFNALLAKLQASGQMA